MKIYKVGGAVRDGLLGVKAIDNDWVVVGSSPDEMISEGFKPVGKDFPVFLHPETKEEYALARTERKSGTGYHGFTFHFGKEVTLEEDLLRRDFTINAMAQDENNNIIDPLNGQIDLNNQIFKHASEAFLEDPLRAIRLARFFTYDHLKDFSIDGSTIDKVNQIISSDEISKLSSERVWTETSRALCSSNPSNYFEKIISLDLIEPFFENLKIAHCHSHSDSEIRWSELQINNHFKLGNTMPIPNEFKNASNVLKNISKITNNVEESHLIKIIKGTQFKRNKDLIDKLLTLPCLSKNKDYVSSIANELHNTDFSFLSGIPKEKVETEKSKIYKKILKNFI